MCELKPENTASESLISDSLLLKDLGKTVEAPCSHVYHAQCLKKWLSSKVECPVCRNKIQETLEEVISSEDETPQVSLTTLSCWYVLRKYFGCFWNRILYFITP